MNKFLRKFQKPLRVTLACVLSALMISSSIPADAVAFAAEQVNETTETTETTSSNSLSSSDEEDASSSGSTTESTSETVSSGSTSTTSETADASDETVSSDSTSDETDSADASETSDSSDSTSTQTDSTGTSDTSDSSDSVSSTSESTDAAQTSTTSSDSDSSSQTVEKSTGSTLSSASKSLVMTAAQFLGVSTLSATDLSGSAYAVLDDNGTLYFVRSTASYTSGESATVTSISGGTYTGTVYPVNETSGVNEAIVGSANAASVKSVVFVDDVRPKYMNSWFEGCTNLKTVTTNGKLDTTILVGMQYMFSGCTSLTSIDDISSWTSADGLNMIAAFQYCSSLKTLDLSGFAGKKVKYITSAFDGCTSLESIKGIEDLDVSGCVNFNSLFNNCKSLKSLDLSDWSTSNITSVSSMFAGCSSLTSLDLSKWDTRNFTNLASLFAGCTSLTSLNVSTWDVSKVTTATYVFVNCTSLESLDLSNWDTSAVTNGYAAFANDSALNSVTLGSNFKFSTTGSGGLYVLPTPNNISKKWQKGDDATTARTPAEMASLSGDDIAGTWVWSETVYTISFDANGGSGSMDPQKSVEGAAVTLASNAFTNGSYDFAEWNTAADGSGTSYADGATITPTADMTLYAQWAKGNLRISTSSSIPDGASSEEQSRTFTYKVTLTKDNAELTGNYTVTGATETSISSGDTLTISGGDSATISNLPAGTTYTVEEISVPSGWTLSSSSDSTGSIQTDATSTASFTNTYAASGSATINATVELNGGTLSSGEFTFELLDSSQTEVLQTTTNGVDDDATAVVFSLDYVLDSSQQQTGTHTYYIHEVADSSMSTMDFDDSYVKVTVTVYDAGGGVLAATVTYGDDDSTTSPTFTNTGHAMLDVYKYALEDSVETPLSGVTFTLYQGSDWDSKVAVDTDTSDEDGTLVFSSALDANSTYWLVETTAPDGYSLADPYVIETDSTLSSASVGQAVASGDGYVAPSDDAFTSETIEQSEVTIEVQDAAIEDSSSTDDSETTGDDSSSESTDQDDSTAEGDDTDTEDSSSTDDSETTGDDSSSDSTDQSESTDQDDSATEEDDADTEESSSTDDSETSDDDSSSDSTDQSSATTEARNAGTGEVPDMGDFGYESLALAIVLIATAAALHALRRRLGRS